MLLGSSFTAARVCARFKKESRPMDRRTAFTSAIFIVVFLGACTHSPVQRQEATAESLDSLRDTMQQARAQIDKTLASLNALERAPDGQLRDSYKQFADDVDAMTKQAAAI